MKTTTTPLLLLLVPAVLALCVDARAADLEVEVQGLAGNEGQVLLAAYADAGSWLKKPVAVARADAAEARDGRLVLRVPGLPEGAALSLFHDRDGNGRLNMNAMGMPIEPYGFSNDAAGRFGPPSFEQARIAAPTAARVVVHLN